MCEGAPPYNLQFLKVFFFKISSVQMLGSLKLEGLKSTEPYMQNRKGRKESYTILTGSASTLSAL